MAAAEIPKRPPPPDYMVKGAARMCPAVLGWRNIKVLRGRKNSLGMEISIGGFLIISEIIFMMECTWIMILEMDTKHGRQSLKKKKAPIKNDNSNTSITAQGNSDKRQLKLSDKIQASMMTDLKLSKDEVYRLMTAYNSDF